MLKLYKIHFSTIDSTNSFAKNNILSLDREKLTVITTNFQTSGRGRQGREWNSPEGKNLLATYCFFVTTNHQVKLSNLAQIAALTVAITLEKLDFSPKIKWPNDIFLSNKKVAGILCETLPIDHQILAVVGIGLNVNWPYDQTIKMDQPITSLLLEKGCELPLKELISSLTVNFQKVFEIFLMRGFDPFFLHYQKRLLYQSGQTIRFHVKGRLVEGIFHSLSKDGAIHLILDGKLQKFYTFD